MGVGLVRSLQPPDILWIDWRVYNFIANPNKGLFFLLPSEQPHKLLPLHETTTRRNNQSMRVNKPFSYQEIQRIKEDLGDCLEHLEKYISAFKGVTLLYDLTWQSVMYVLGSKRVRHD